MDLVYLCLLEQQEQVGCGRCAAGRHIISGAEFKHRHVNIRQIVETHQRECFLNLLESFHISVEPIETIWKGQVHYCFLFLLSVEPGSNSSCLVLV